MDNLQATGLAMENTNGKKKLKPFYRRLLKLTGKIVILVAVFAAIFHFVFGIHYLRGNYMFPALRDGDLVMTYKLEEAVKNNVVLYEHNGEERLGRIVGYEGDTIAFSVNGELLVNGCVASEEIFYPTAERNADENKDASSETNDTENETDSQDVYTVPEGCVYILNDYRTEGTTDSRDFGAVPKKDLKGKLFLMLRRRGF